MQENLRTQKRKKVNKNIKKISIDDTKNLSIKDEGLINIDNFFISMQREGKKFISINILKRLNLAM